MYDASFNYGAAGGDELADPRRPGYAEHGRNLSKSSGLRNELARGETQEYLNELESGRGPYGDEKRGAAGGAGGKLRKAGGGGGGPPMNASSVIGYQDDDDSHHYDYNGYEGGFQPPHSSSELRGPRY